MLANNLLNEVNHVKDGDYKSIIKVIAEYQSLVTQHKDNVNTIILESIPEMKSKFESEKWKEGLELLRYAIQSTRDENTYKDSGNKFA